MSRTKNQTYQLTIRLEGELARRVKEAARRASCSLNQAVVQLLRQGAGLDRHPGEAIGTRLDRFAGVLSKEERDEIDAAVAEAFGRPDPDLWR